MIILENLRRGHLRLAPLLSLLLPAPFALAGFSFSGIGFLPGAADSVAHSISADGSTIVGRSGDRAYVWSTSTGMLPIGPLGTTANAVSADGSVVIGHRQLDSSPGFIGEAFRWTAADGLVGIGDLPGGSLDSRGTGVSDNGSYVVGSGDITGIGAPQFHAFRWNERSGFEDLGDLQPGTLRSSNALGISPDGTTVVGTGEVLSGREAFRWSADAGIVGLGDLEGGGSFRSRAYSSSTDGEVIVGSGSSVVADLEPFRWTAEHGMIGLGVLSEFVGGEAYDLSADGNIIVGGIGSNAGFIWDEENGMRNLHMFLSENGADLDGWLSIAAHGISADGTVLTGYGSHNGNIEAWVAVVPEPSCLGILSLLAIAFSRRRHQASAGLQGDGFDDQDVCKGHELRSICRK